MLNKLYGIDSTKPTADIIYMHIILKRINSIGSGKIFIVKNLYNKVLKKKNELYYILYW